MQGSRKECHRHKKVTIFKIFHFVKKKLLKMSLKGFMYLCFLETSLKKQRYLLNVSMYTPKIYNICAPDDPPSSRTMTNLF